MTIQDFIIHRIDKKQHAEPVVFLRSTALQTNDNRVERFTSLAAEVFKANEDKPSSVYADFNVDRVNYPLSTWCLEYFIGAKSFLQFTRDCTKRLSLHMKAQPLSTGGFVVFARFMEQSKTQLLIVMLHPQEGLSITDSLEFADVSHLELKHMDKAALIAAPSNGTFGDKPLIYAGFRKEMSRYFQEFIGPDLFRNPNKDSHKLIEAVENYASEACFDQARLGEIRAKLKQYVQDCTDNEQELDLLAVSAIVHPRKPNAFRTYASQAGVSGYIKPDNSVFKNWRVIRYKSRDGLVLQFKAEMVGPVGTNYRLQLDEAAKTLTITKVEEDLILKIRAAKTPGA